MPEGTNPRTLLEEILSSPGMAHVNRTFARTFSLNIFRRNAQELLAATHMFGDSDHALRLMAVDNREAGQQAHRELNRFVHNFVTGAMTLVDHTRNFMRENYEGASVKHDYDNHVKEAFVSEPIVQFVQNLRNYFVHKGLPDSEIFMEFKSGADGASAGGTLETGIRYRTGTFLQWDGWNAPAKRYMESAGEFIDIHAFTVAYLEKILAFQGWLDGALDEFHAGDLAQLGKLQANYAQLSSDSFPGGSSRPQSKTEGEPAAPNTSSVTQFEFPTHAAAAIDEVGRVLLTSMRKLDLGVSVPNTFPSERPTVIIKADELLEMPILRGPDTEGRSVIAFAKSGDDIFGLDFATFAQLGPLAEKIRDVAWVKSSLSSNFIEQTSLKWLRRAFRGGQQESLAHALSSASREEVDKREFWAPVACLEIQERFEFGPAEIAPISRYMMDQREAEALNSCSDAQRANVAKLFADLRSKMQGLASVVVRMEAEQSHILEQGMAIAQNAVGLLRFFCPVARIPTQVCSVAILGTEALPRSQALVLGDKDFLFSDGSVFQPYIWRLSKEGVSALMATGLAKASSLALPDRLNEFQLAVRAGILLCSTSATFVHASDRLVNVLSALEGVLLRHSMEPTEYCVEERMSLLLASDSVARNQVARNVRDAYRLRRRQGASVLSPRDQDALAIFVHNAYAALCTALENVNSFTTKVDFIGAIEARKSNVTVP